MLFPVHRAGKAAADCSWLPRVTPAALSAIALVLSLSALATPLAAHAQDTFRDPVKKFGDTPTTDSGDAIVNDKTVDLVDSVDFDDGGDTLTNNGTITIGATSTSPVKIRFLSLEGMKNTGLIDMRNGHVGDVLSMTLDYTASGKARLGLDVGPGGADQLVVDRVANGKTAVLLGGITAQTATLTGDKGPVLIRAGDGSTKDAFYVENADIGFLRYGLIQDVAADKSVTYRLKSVAGKRAYEMLKVSETVRDVWRQSADAWSAHVLGLRDAGHDANGAGVWGQAFGGRVDRDDTIKSGISTVDSDYRQTTYGGQMGVDLINAGVDDGRILLGLTGGYADARQRFSGVAGQTVKLQIANIGGYLGLTRGGYFLNALAKVDRQSIKATSGPDAIKLDFDGTAYGGQIEAGARSENDGVIYEQLLSINYVSGRLDDVNAFAQQRLDFDKSSGFIAKAGVRGAVQGQVLGGVLTTYGAAFVVHDFTIKNGLDLVSGDQVEHLSQDGGRTFGQLTAGLSYRAAGAVVTFVEGSGEAGGGRSGGGLRLGVRIGF
ncbi:autotransporter outer membrane beta-barrel domain-containing protein [Caulobacter segnis]